MIKSPEIISSSLTSQICLNCGTWMGWEQVYSSLSLPRHLTMVGYAWHSFFAPCFPEAVQYEDNNTALNTEQHAGEKGLIELFIPLLFFSARLKVGLTARSENASFHTHDLQVFYLSCARWPGYGPRLWHFWHSKCNSVSNPLVWLLQQLESLWQFCLQNL